MTAEDVNSAQDNLTSRPTAIWDAKDGTGEVLMLGVAKNRADDLVVFRRIGDTDLQVLSLRGFVDRYRYVELLSEREEKLLAQQYHDLARLTSGMAGAENYTEGFIIGMVGERGRVIGPYWCGSDEQGAQSWSLGIDDAFLFADQFDADRFLAQLTLVVNHQNNLAVMHVYRFNPLTWGEQPMATGRMPCALKPVDNIPREQPTPPEEVSVKIPERPVGASPSFGHPFGQPVVLNDDVYRSFVEEAKGVHFTAHNLVVDSEERKNQILALMEEIFRDNQLTMDKTLSLLGEIEGAALAMRSKLTDPLG